MTVYTRDGGLTVRRDDTRIALRRRNAARTAIFWWTMGFATCAGLLLGALSSDYFRIREVRVHCPNESLRLEAADALRALHYGTTWLPPTHEIERRIAGLSRARDVRVERRLPRTLEVHVEPRAPAAVVEVDHRLLAIDEEGVCLTWTGAADPSLVILRIADPSGLRVGGRLSARDAALFREALAGLREAKLAAGARLDISNSQRVELFTADGVLGKLGEDQALRSKIVYFGQLLQGLRAAGRRPLSIDLRVPDKPSYLPLD